MQLITSGSLAASIRTTVSAQLDASVKAYAYMYRHKTHLRRGPQAGAGCTLISLPWLAISRRLLRPERCRLDLGCCHHAQLPGQSSDQSLLCIFGSIAVCCRTRMPEPKATPVATGWLQAAETGVVACHTPVTTLLPLCASLGGSRRALFT